MMTAWCRMPSVLDLKLLRYWTLWLNFYIHDQPNKQVAFGQCEDPFESSHAQTVLYNQESRIGNVGDLGNYSVRQATSSTDSAMGNIDNLQQLASPKNYMNDGGDLRTTRVNARAYQPLQQSNSEKLRN
ncbi:hypothetical protein PVK06_032247 [Gossypium arboreum]|uniref:Uncharacterized protein n=1 Tax=Gossypium arboreum TaxID=29729 RepID=A0ABR0NUF9_GOSAR|nr:hypothetical protein PVK06_032247 [Gossypium arboreum]